MESRESAVQGHALALALSHGLLHSRTMAKPGMSGAQQLLGPALLSHGFPKRQLIL